VALGFETFPSGYSRHSNDVISPSLLSDVSLTDLLETRPSALPLSLPSEETIYEACARTGGLGPDPDLKFVFRTLLSTISLI
jgi:hypothetical protein